MPKIKISQLPAKAANLAATDLLEVSEVSGLTYVSKKITGSELVGNRVPYTGATANVDLGTFHLDAGKGTFSHNGSTDTLTANHTSGAGIGLLITKGGNNEGLKVNKTSGSGNAATIIGTLEATTIVKTGGLSTQFLMADGTTSLGGGITVGTTSSTGTDGRVFFQAGGVVQQDGAFNWDNTNKRLGIGISTPSTILHVAANYSGGLDALQPQMLVQNTNTTPAATKTSMIRVNVGTGYSGGYPEIWLESQQTAGGAGLTKIRTISNSPLLFYTNDLERARFSETGNFGIGAGASPGARLDVRAQGALTTDIAFRVRNSADTRNFLTVNGAGDVFNSGAQGVTGNTFYGENSGRSSTGAFNSFLGFEAGRDNSTGTNNCFFGVEAGRVNTTASGNSFFGAQAGRGNTGIYNSFFGAGAGINNSTGTYNSFLGVSAGEGNSTGAFNSCLGFQAGQNNTTGSENVFSGVEAGRKILSGASLTVVNNSVFLGGLTRANANSETNQIVIGHSAIGLGSNTTVIGNTSTTRWKLFGAGIVENITAPSSSVTDSFHVYSNDITAGNAAPHFRTENGSIIKLYQNAAVTTTQGVADALTNLGLLASSTIAPTVQSVASAATVTPTFTNDLVKITAQAVALTLAAPTGTAIDGKDLMIRIKDNGTAQTIAWTSGTGGYRAIGVTLPTTTTAGKTTYVGLIYNSDDSIWDVIGVTTQA